MDIAQVYDEYADKVYNFFYIKSFDRTTAEDLTSQTFMAVLQKMQDPDYVIQDGKKFVYGVMRNVWLMYLRQKYQRNEAFVENIEDFGGYVEEETDIYETLTVKQRAELFINKLPDKQREILTMRLLEGLSIKDICGATGKDSNYVKTTYKRGVKSLRALVAEATV